MWLVVDGTSVLKTIYDTLVATNQLKYYRLMKKTLYYILQQAISFYCSNIIIVFDYSPYNKLNKLQNIYKRSEWINSFEVASIKQDADIETDETKKRSLLQLYQQSKLILEQQKVFFKAKNRLIKDYSDTQIRILQVPHEMSLDILRETVEQLINDNQKVYVISNDYNIFSVLDFIDFQDKTEKISLYNIVYNQERDKFNSIYINVKDKYSEEIALSKQHKVNLLTMSYIKSLYAGTNWLRKSYIQQENPISFEEFTSKLLSNTDDSLKNYSEALKTLYNYQSKNIQEYVTKIIQQTVFDDTKAVSQFKQICTTLINFYTQLNCPYLEE